MIHTQRIESAGSHVLSRCLRSRGGRSKAATEPGCSAFRWTLQPSLVQYVKANGAKLGADVCVNMTENQFIDLAYKLVN